MENETEILLNNLFEVKKERNLSDEFLGRKIDVSSFTVYRWRKGLHLPVSQPIVEKIKNVIKELKIHNRNKK